MTNYDILKEYEAHKTPVPSYDDWQKLLDTNDTIFRQIKDLNNENYELEKQNKQLRKWCEEFNALEVAKENQHLKELLKEVRDAWVIYKPYDRNQLCKRITNAIGEKKGVKR